MTIMVYLFFLVGRSVWQNQRNMEEINQVKAEIKNQEQENERLREVIEYEKTDAFKEKQLRQKLGYKKEGEVVISIPENADDHVSPSPSPSLKALAESALKVPNYIYWLKYLSGE